MNKSYIGISTALGAILLVVASATSALAANATEKVVMPPEPGLPKVGGHLGLAVPVVTFGPSTTVIGGDYIKLGIAPGVTFRLEQRWAVDFEFVAYNDFKPGGSASFVVDPGVIYTLDVVSVGLRTAINTGPTQNWGFIPIATKAVPIGPLVNGFVELDVPIFIQPSGSYWTIQPQFGVSF